MPRVDASRRLRSAALGALLLGGAAGCGGASSAGTGGALGSVPAEFRDACGRPGSTVELQSTFGTVRHRACDLTEVTLRHGEGGTVVPARGGGVAGSNGLIVETNRQGDVTYRVAAPPD